jgi:IS30 family transposase
MPSPYEHLSRSEREKIAIGQRAGGSQRAIGRALGRRASTICRELRRNRSTDGVYRARRAQALANERAGWPRRQSKMKDSRVRQHVEDRLRMRWSPEQISGRQRLEEERAVSRTTIYRHTMEYPEYRAYLRGPDPDRRRRRQRHERIRNRRMIDERPAAAEQRERAGDWESDTMKGPKASKACLATHVDRATRYLVTGLMEQQTAEALNDTTVQAMEGLPVHTLTVDNGMEFGRFRVLERRLKAKVFFAHEHCPWQRGCNENTNGLLRQFFPRSTDFARVSPAELRRANALLNNRPRKCLGYRTPKEAMQALGVALET